MSERDLVKELKAEIAEITIDRDDALTKMKSKESRMKQVLIKLEHATQDVHTCGHKIGEQNKEIADLKASWRPRPNCLMRHCKGSRTYMTIRPENHPTQYKINTLPETAYAI